MKAGRRQIVMLAPLALASACGVGFFEMLRRMGSGDFDPHMIKNPLLGKPIPQFTLPGLGNHPGFSADDLRAASAKKPVLVNFFASWCIPCAAEADIVGGLAAEGLAFWGVAYEDKPAAAQGFLDKYGDPYARIARDETGRVAIDWGIYGVPETFLIRAGGIIHWHLPGPLSDDIVQGQLRPALRELGS